MKRLIIGVAAVCTISLALIFTRQAGAPSSSDNPSKSGPATLSGFNKQKYPIDQPGSIWWIVNKVSPLDPATYAPDDLVTPNMPLRLDGGDSQMRMRKEASSALEEMVLGADKVGIRLELTSGYRSYQLQVSLYNESVQQYGQAGADKQSERPGTSEHQTGLAADLEPTTGQCELEVCFADLPEGKWLAANAYLYGFIIRYPEGKAKITGYDHEPWHVRYVGKDLSAEMHKQNIQTMEEFFGVVPDSQPY